MSNWKDTVFDNVVRLNRGFDLPNQKIEDGAYPVVASTSIKAFHKQFKVEGPGVVTGRSGSLGSVQYIPGRFWPLNTTLYAKDFRGNDKRFVAYFLQTMHLEKFDSGAGVPTLNQNHLHKLAVRLPSLSTQKKITAVLSAYDKLIENNTRRIALLEKMAEEIYREWFVRMRFPGREKAKFKKGIPEGWEVTYVGDAFSIMGGGTPSKSESSYWVDGDINWFTPSDITAANGVFLSSSGLQCNEVGLNQSSSRLFPAYSIMMTSRATIGALGINTTPACTNQGFITCLPNERYPLPFLYFWLKLSKPYFEMLSTGATFAELSKATFKKTQILTPTEKLMKQFDEMVMPMFRENELLLPTVENLKTTRDRLLTRLISGKLSVEDLDIEFPPSIKE